VCDPNVEMNRVCEIIQEAIADVDIIGRLIIRGAIIVSLNRLFIGGNELIYPSDICYGVASIQST
jgi:hypothetical protein